MTMTKDERMELNIKLKVYHESEMTLGIICGQLMDVKYGVPDDMTKKITDSYDMLSDCRIKLWLKMQEMFKQLYPDYEWW